MPSHAINVWCPCHHGNVAMGHIFEQHPVLEKMRTMAKKVAKFYNCSSVRCTDLDREAAKLEIRLVKFPHHKDIRFTEFLIGLLRSILSNMRAMLADWHTKAATGRRLDVEKKEREQITAFRVRAHLHVLSMPSLNTHQGFILFACVVRQKSTRKEVSDTHACTRNTHTKQTGGVARALTFCSNRPTTSTKRTCE